VETKSSTRVRQRYRYLPIPQNANDG